ncbi:hypothetical protein FB451DRAFT_1394555 [Mycena latifolia]|nr:hypothetical protein FB451DRAFT_1394555 [Mycena latifolia]
MLPATQLPVIYRVPNEIWDTISHEICFLSPRRLCRFHSVISRVLGVTVRDQTWRACYLYWFSYYDAFPLTEYRNLCFASVRYYNAPKFVAARCISSVFVYHPHINYPERDVLRLINLAHPTISLADVQEAFPLVAPLFKNTAAVTADKWNHQVQHFRVGVATTERYRQLYRLGSRPYPLPSPLPKTTITILLSTVPANQPSKEAKGRLFFEQTMPYYKRCVDNLLSASAGQMMPPAIPLCLPSMPELLKISPPTWLNRTLGNVPGSSRFPGGLAPNPLGLDEDPEKLRSAAHLKMILECGADQQDVLLLLYHPAADPLHTLEAWGELCHQLTPRSQIGYCFPADLSIENGWDTSVFGNDGLDYILTVSVDALRRMNGWLESSVPPQTLEALAAAGDLPSWLAAHGMGVPEAERITAVVDRTRHYRRRGKVYKGNNPRVAGEAVAGSYANP